MKATLMLEDGLCLTAEASGAPAERIGRMVLNTAVVGYQEIVTDPANAGRIVLMTYPLIGNYGTAKKFNQSKQVWAAGLAVKEVSRIFSNWQAEESLQDFAGKNGLCLLAGLDTRTLAVHLRQKGEMLAIFSTQTSSSKDLQAKLKAYRQKIGESLLPQISCRTVSKPAAGRGIKTLVIDLGATRNFLDSLEGSGFALGMAGYSITAEQVLKLKPQAVIISGGPEEDPGLDRCVETVNKLVGRVPLLGVGTGHQVLARSLGAKVVRLKIGHHGVNYPVHHAPSRASSITVQNHSLTVDPDSLAGLKGMRVTAYNLNDHTTEEIENARLRCLGVQYEPTPAVFARFKKLIKRSS